MTIRRLARLALPAVACAAPSAAPPAALTGDGAEGPDEPVGTTLVTAMRGESLEFETPWSSEVVGADDLRRRSYRTTPQALRDLPSVLLQETAPGQGSPFLRGFTGFRSLLLIDGIRLNDSVFREGPNQYWNTVDPLSVERFEVVFGPGSVLWGSDAVGGTVNAITRLPWAWGEEGAAGVRALYRVSSAESSHTGRIEGSASSGDRTGVLFGLTGKTFGDLEGGSDIGTQQETGYDEWDGDLKVEHFLAPGTRLVLAHQHVRQNDVPRTHSTVFAKSFEGSAVGSDLRRETDQKRSLTYAQVHGEDLDGFYDRASVSVSWHVKEELQDRIRGNGVQEHQGFDVHTLGVFANLSSPTAIGRLTYGLEYYRDEVGAFLDRGALQTPEDDIQGPVGDDSTYDLFGAFVQDELPVSADLDLVLGGRFSWARADSDSVRDPVANTRIAVRDEWSSLVGSARLLYRLREDVNLYGGVSQGFRAPNLSDLTRFDNARSNEFEIPAVDLDPEHFVSYEAGVKLLRGRSRARLAVFYTDIEDQIVRFPTGNVNGSGDAEITRDNVGDGYVAGIELSGAQELAPRWTLAGAASWQDGELSTFPTSAPALVDEPIDRLMPLVLQAALRWEDVATGLWSEVQGVWADDADELSTRDAADTQRIPPGGTPGYALLHLRGGFQVSESVSVTLALENVTDEDYRVHGSGTNSPGRNAILTLSAVL